LLFAALHRRQGNQLRRTDLARTLDMLDRNPLAFDGETAMEVDHRLKLNGVLGAGYAGQPGAGGGVVDAGGIRHFRLPSVYCHCHWDWFGGSNGGRRAVTDTIFVE
jgi:hypothetical protein